MRSFNMMRWWAAPLIALVLGSSGCSNTVRYMTTMTWRTAPGGSTGPATAGEPAPGSAAAPAGAAGDAGRTFYITYWEGSCSSGLLGFGKGCSAGDSKVRRCNAKPDNSMECVDEVEANLAFARKK